MSPKSPLAIAPVRFVYLDLHGIESLYSQTVDRVETSLLITKEKTAGRRIGLSLSLGKLLGNLIGVEPAVSADTTTEGKESRASSYNPTSENRLFSLIAHLSRHSPSSFFRSLRAAANAARHTQGSVFVSSRDKWDAPQFHPGQEGVRDVNNTGAVIFTFGQPSSEAYEPSDDYFRHPPTVIGMAASLINFPHVHAGRMTSTGHDAMLFRAHKGKAIPLAVFGQLTPLPEPSFQMKPYAIWI